MKKIFSLMAGVLMALSLSAEGSYGVLVNGSKYFPGTKVDEFEGFQQYLAHVPLKVGDICQLCDAESHAVWAVELNKASVEGVALDGSVYKASKEGCYDFYIKLKYNQDELYIGNGSNCGEGIDVGGAVGDDVNYYAIGWINGEDHGERDYETYEDDLMFDDGKVAINCTMGSYIAIKDHMGNFYYARGNSDATGDKVTFEWAYGWSPCQKWAILEGQRYLIIRSAQYKGKIEVESVSKDVFDAYHYGSNQAIENVVSNDKARKQIINGQLRIIRGDKIFDATGKQVNK
ncbi:MAG: hypothetical protein IKS76_01325 [Paludibacteraceae bacterium]|nr:hypothetical protein [Paludibacteraceae bacterium]